MGQDWYNEEIRDREFNKQVDMFYRVFSILFKSKLLREYIIHNRFAFIRAAQKAINERLPDWDVMIKLKYDE